MNYISTNRVFNCTLSIKLDKRTNKRTKEYPLCVCFNLMENGKQKRYYHNLGEYYTDAFFTSVCNCTSSRSSMMPKRKEWEQALEEYRQRISKIAKIRTLSIDVIKSCLARTATNEQVSFLQIWRDVIRMKSEEGRAGTAESYECALKSFLKIIGEIKGFAISKEIIQQWNEGMKNGVLQNGKTVGKIADATRGIYLRTCRVIWNECTRQGFLVDVEYPFSNKDNSLVSIPRGKLRQQSYLNIEEMTELYRVFDEKRYPESWNPQYIEKVHLSLGLFLAQYLCNGCNLADIARLQYNNTYYKEGGKAFEFMRHKTAARSNNNSVVIVPITKPLKRILDDIAAPPVKGCYVFPFIIKGISDEEERRRHCCLENSNVKDRLQRVCKEILGWDKTPTGTWARHSFATNLKLAGVEEEYIAESMGHSHGNDVTRGYQDMYPLEIRERYNLKLLKIEDEPKEKIDIDSLSPDEMKKLLKKLLNNSTK